MAQRNFLEEKAHDYNLDLSEPTGKNKLLVCKYVLLGLMNLLENPPHIVKLSVDVLSTDLWHVVVVFRNISSEEAQSYSLQGYVQSIEAIYTKLKKACQYTDALKEIMDDDYDNKPLSVRLEASECVMECADRIKIALEYFILD